MKILRPCSPVPTNYRDGSLESDSASSARAGITLVEAEERALDLRERPAPNPPPGVPFPVGR